MAKFANEAAEYETAIAVLNKIAPATTADFDKTPMQATQSGNSQPGTIASRILTLMRESDKRWWTANEIQDELGKTGDPVKMTSISPNLSRLKENGEIVRDELNVALANRASRNVEASEGMPASTFPSEASIETRSYQSGESPAQGREAVPGGGT